MLSRPSARRKTANQPVTLNLVPMLDALVTLIGFLLYTMSFLAIVSIESPFPISTAREIEQKIKQKPLQLTVTLRETDAEIWSPFDRIPPKRIPSTAEGKPDTRAIHEALIAIKMQFKDERNVVIVPYPGMSYDVLIAVMDSLRTLEPTDPTILVKNEKTGVDEQTKLLFPDVIFGNLLGDS